MATLRELPGLGAQTVLEYKFHGTFGDKVPFKFANLDSNLLERIYALFRTVMAGMMRFGMFVMSPSIFAMGFIAGIVWDEFTYTAMAKIHLVWMQQNLGTKAVVGLGAILALPVVFSALTFFTGSNISGSMYQQLQYQLNTQNWRG